MRLQIERNKRVVRNEQDVYENGYKLKIDEDNKGMFTCIRLTYDELIKLKDRLEEVIEQDFQQ